NGTVTKNAGGGFDVSGTNTYAESGRFPVNVDVMDFGGAAVSVNNTAVVAEAHVDDIVGRAPGGAVITAVSNGTNAFTTTQWATWPSNVTWVDVVVGDYNGDGVDDLAARQMETGQWWVALSNGANAFTFTQWAV